MLEHVAVSGVGGRGVAGRRSTLAKDVPNWRVPSGFGIGVKCHKTQLVKSHSLPIALPLSCRLAVSLSLVTSLFASCRLPTFHLPLVYLWVAHAIALEKIALIASHNKCYAYAAYAHQYLSHRHTHTHN